ncbi:MAG: hypothetical protein ACOC8K_06945 [Gemmatimonadota bacterium]
MHETVSPEAHGLIDYVTVVTFALAPTLFQFDGVPALVAWGLAGAHLVLTLSTRFPMGLFDGVPLRAHGVVELVVSVALIILPWVAGFVQPGAQWFFPVMGIFVFLIWLLSDYRQLERLGRAPAEGALPASRGPGAAEDAAELPRGATPETRASAEDGPRKEDGASEKERSSEARPLEDGSQGDRVPEGPSQGDDPHGNAAGGNVSGAGETEERGSG